MPIGIPYLIAAKVFLHYRGSLPSVGAFQNPNIPVIQTLRRRSWVNTKARGAKWFLLIAYLRHTTLIVIILTNYRKNICNTRQKKNKNERQSIDYHSLTVSGKRDSDPRPQPWQGCALPTELFPQFIPALQKPSFPAFRDCKYKSKIFILQNFPAIFVA